MSLGSLSGFRLPHIDRLAARAHASRDAAAHAEWAGRRGSPHGARSARCGCVWRVRAAHPRIRAAGGHGAATGTLGGAVVDPVAVM